MADHPASPDRELRERHAHLEGDSRLLRHDGDGTEALEDRDEGGVDQAHRRIRPGEVGVEGMAAAGVALIAVGELSAAGVARP